MFKIRLILFCASSKFKLLKYNIKLKKIVTYRTTQIVKRVSAA